MSEPYFDITWAEHQKNCAAIRSRVDAAKMRDRRREKEILLAISISSAMACGLGVVIGMILMTFGRGHS